MSIVSFPAELFTPIQAGLTAVEARLREAITDQHPSLAAATERLLHAGGKRIRPAICLLTAGIFDADPDKSISLAAAVEMLHTATLVHDDLIDGSLLRRSTPTLNANWSPNRVVLTGDYLFARAAHFGAQTNSIRVMNLFSQTLMTVVNGEIKQMFSSRRISRDDYYERIYAKTAAMFVLATEAATILGDADEASMRTLSEFGYAVGMAYQIADDVLDFVGDPDQMGKPVGSDLRQGTLTLPVIYYIETHPNDPDVRALLDGRLKNRDAIPRLVTAVRESGAIERAMREARKFVARAQLTIEKLPGSVYVAALSELGDYIVSRNL